jgi:hypothetical protein
MAGSDNKLNMVEGSLIFSRLAEGNSPKAHYEINDHQ